jgi:5'-3' exonuclease
MKLLIDGDILVYRCGFAAQTGRGEDVVVEPVENAYHNVTSVVDTIMHVLESDDICVYLSGDENFRFDIATERPYKGNRDPAAKPVHYAALHSFIKRKYPHKVSENQEADDDLGIEQIRLTEGGEWGNSCIVSIDKDLDMIPGNHYNWVREEPYFVDELDAWKAFYTQLITGDVTDNIPGIPKKGAKAAQKALADLTTPEEMYLAVRELYVQTFTEKFADEALLEQARLLWIRRYPDEMWEPPNDC